MYEKQENLYVRLDFFMFIYFRYRQVTVTGGRIVSVLVIATTFISYRKYLSNEWKMRIPL